MPFGGLLSLGTAAISGGSALASLFGGSNAPQAPQLNTYNYGNLGGADVGAYSGIGGLSQWNVPGQLLPQYSGIAQGMVNNPYAAMYQGAAIPAATMGMQGATGAFGAGGNLMGTSLSTLPDVNALMTLGFDPQNALYNRTLQQVQDQTRAGLEARGVDSTPYGAGVEGQTLSNFNIDWQNNLLNRASTASGAAGSLLGQAGTGIGQGANLQASAPGNFLTAGGLPYNTFQGIGANQLGALQQLGGFGLQGAQLPQQQIQDYLQYLQQGTQAAQGFNQNQTALFQAQNQGQNQQFWQNQQLGQNLGGALQGIGKAWPTAANTFSDWGGSSGFTPPTAPMGTGIWPA